MRYLVRDRVFGIGDDFWVEDENGRKAFLVDGKALRLRKTFELKDSSGREVARITSKALSVRSTMRIERDGRELAVVREKHLTPMRKVFRAELASGGELEVKGDLIGKEYGIDHDGRRVATISRKWFRVRDAYAVQIEQPGADAALLIAVAVCVDHLASD